LKSPHLKASRKDRAVNNIGVAWVRVCPIP
jgi:hypothetical protein